MNVDHNRDGGNSLMMKIPTKGGKKFPQFFHSLNSIDNQIKITKQTFILYFYLLMFLCTPVQLIYITMGFYLQSILHKLLKMTF